MLSIVAILALQTRGSWDSSAQGYAEVIKAQHLQDGAPQHPLHADRGT